MIYFIIWAVLGITGQFMFMYLMKKEYGDIYTDDLKTDYILPFQFIMSVLAGPITFLVLIFIFNLKNS